MSPASFLIIEDHPIFRRALLAMLNEAFPASLFFASGTLSEGKTIIERSRTPPIVILDVNLPDSQGTDGARQLLRLVPGLKIIALSADDSVDRQIRLLKLGVHGFLSKTLSPELFIARLNELIRNGASSAADTCSPDQPGLLSSRQRVVMVEMSRGISNKEIALSLGIGSETVKSHVSEIIRRLGVRNRAEAVRAFQQQEASIEDSN